MDLDLRVPVGLLFVVLGLIMTIFGFTSDPALYQKSLGINVNVQWGIVELIFGSLMVAFGRSATQHAARKAVTSHHDLAPPVLDADGSTVKNLTIETRSAAKRRVPRA